MVKLKFFIFLFLATFILVGARCGKAPAGTKTDEKAGEKQEGLSEKEITIEQIRKFCRWVMAQEPSDLASFEECVESFGTKFFHPDGQEAGAMKWCIKKCLRISGDTEAGCSEYCNRAMSMEENKRMLEAQRKKILEF